MILEDYLDTFKSDAAKYAHLKDKVHKYISDRYIKSSKSPVSVFSICVGFQMVIGLVPQSAVTYWLEEWGYKVQPSKGGEHGNHNVYIKIKPLHLDTESLISKDWKKRRKGVVIY